MIVRLGLGLVLLVASWMTGQGRPSGRPLLWTWSILTLLVEGSALWLFEGRDGWAWFGSLCAASLLVALAMSGVRASSRAGRLEPLWDGRPDLGRLADDAL
jgi:hypothetical protein